MLRVRESGVVVVGEGRLMVGEEGRGLVGIGRLSREEAIEVGDLIVVVGIDFLIASMTETSVVVADSAIAMIDEVDASAIVTREVVVVIGEAGLMTEGEVDREIGMSRDTNLAFELGKA